MGWSGQKGISLVELLVAMVIAGFISIGAMRLWTGFVKQNAKQTGINELQSQILAAAQLVEKDIRMSGYGLPGNGVFITATASGNDSITVFINRANLETTLAGDVSTGSLTISVANASGARTDQWICLSSADTTIYRDITVIDTIGTDQVQVSAALPYLFAQAGTRVFFADRISYAVDATTPAFARYENDHRFDIGGEIDTFDIVARDSAGSVLASNFRRARTLILMIGGTAAGPGKASPVRQTVEANLRNFR